MPDVECTTILGEKKLVPAEELIIRPSAYGLIEHEGKLLVVSVKSTDKWFFPGGAVELGETLEQALHREIKEETGITVEVEKFFTFVETFFYYNQAYHSLNFFYICRPLKTTLFSAGNEPGDEAQRAEWIDLQDLKPEVFQSFAGEIFQQYQAL